MQAALTLPPGSLQWMIGWMYYVSFIMAEVFGASNVSQIVHLFPNANNIYTPGYTIYKNRNPARLALFNFNTDPLGFSYYNATFAIGGSGVNSEALAVVTTAGFCVVLYCTICHIQRQLPVGRPGSYANGIDCKCKW